MTPAFRAWLRDYLRTYLSRVVQLLDLTRSSANGYDGVGGQQAAGDEPEVERTVYRMQHYGLRSRPRPTSQCVVLPVNCGAGNNVCIATETPGTGPQNQADDDVELYSAHGQRVQLNADKRLQLDAPSPADVVVNGGTAKVARVGDKDFDGELYSEAYVNSTVMPPTLKIRLLYRSNDPASPYFMVPKLLLQFEVPNGTPHTPPDQGQEVVEIRGRNETGAERFKA